MILVCGCDRQHFVLFRQVSCDRWQLDCLVWICCDGDGSWVLGLLHHSFSARDQLRSCLIHFRSVSGREICLFFDPILSYAARDIYLTRELLRQLRGSLDMSAYVIVLHVHFGTVGFGVSDGPLASAAFGSSECNKTRRAA